MVMLDDLHNVLPDDDCVFLMMINPQGFHLFLQVTLFMMMFACTLLLSFTHVCFWCAFAAFFLHVVCA